MRSDKRAVDAAGVRAPVLGRREDRRGHDGRSRYANIGRIAWSRASECRAVPPVAPMSTGTPSSASCSRTSKNSLNRPLYEALKTGRHRDQPVGGKDLVDGGPEVGATGSRVRRWSTSTRASSRSSMTSVSRWSTPASSRASAVAAASRSASSRVAEGWLRPARDDDQAALGHETLTGSAPAAGSDAAPSSSAEVAASPAPSSSAGVAAPAPAAACPGRPRGSRGSAPRARAPA